MPPSSESITQWTELIEAHMPCLSRPQAQVLALWSYAAQVLQNCGQSQVAFFLAQLLGQKEDTLRQRLREWTWEAAAKAGPKRQAVAVQPCFSCLLVWVLSVWAPGERRLALALDASTLGQRFVVLAISVLYRGCAVPVAWRILPAAQPGAWRPHWEALLAQVQPGIPSDWCVLVLADRGLFAHWLFKSIQQLGWHPFLRINTGGKCRPAGKRVYRPLLDLLRPAGQVWSGHVVCFKVRPLSATLLTYRDAAHTSAWLILTDLEPEAADITWYSLRAWIEAQFKDLKRGGYQWQRTRMTDPERAQRLWLVLALALLCSLSVGDQADSQAPACMLADLPPTHIARRRATGGPKPRRLSLVTRGHLAALAALLRGLPLSIPPLAHNEPWSRP